MKIKITLTVLLIIGCFWAAIHYSEKQQKDKHELYDLKEKYRNNFDSVYLSDLQVFYKDQAIKLIDTYDNWVKVFGKCIDSSLHSLNFSNINHKPLLLHKTDSALYSLSSLHLFDDTRFRVKFTKENLTIEAYQNYDDYADRYPKSYIHSRQPYMGRRWGSRFRNMIIYNRDTLSTIEAISLMFSDGQMMQLTIVDKREVRIP